MRPTRSHRWSLVVFLLIGGGLSTVPESAQAVTGHARAVRATVGAAPTQVTTALADTGPLGGPQDARDASLLAWTIPALLTGEGLHATTIARDERVDSAASLGNLALSIAGTTITAEFVLARATAAAGPAAAGYAVVEGLRVNGLPILATGEPNQRIDVPGGYLLINELQRAPGSASVNALHLVITGVAEVVIASATAGL
jgi:hypothetical protein